MIVAPQFWYGFLNMFSGQTLYDPWIYQMFNICFAALPIVIYAIFDREFKDTTLMKTPSLYSLGLYNKLFTRKIFWSWFFFAFYQAAIIMIVCIFSLDADFIDNAGADSSFWVDGLIIFQVGVIISNIKILLFSNNISFLLLFSIFGSILFFFGSLSAFNLVLSDDYYGILDVYLVDINIYWATFSALVATLGIDWVITRYMGTPIGKFVI